MRLSDLDHFGGKATTAAPRGNPLQQVTRRTIREVSSARGMQDGLRDARLNYRAGQPSNFRTSLNQLGGTADAHYANGLEFWQVREYVRDYDRNTPILGQAVDRALDQILGEGLVVDPQTGDTELDERLKTLWTDWADNPEACDYTWRMPFDQMERLALRHMLIDGDHFALLDDLTGSILLLEADRCASSTAQVTVKSRSGQPIADLVHGVEIDGNSRPLAYWFRKMEVGERQRKRRIFPTVDAPGMVRVMRDMVIHILDPKRVTQSRGMSAFHAVFDRISMHEDIEFAQLVQQQVAACVSAFVTSEFDQQWGSRSQETGSDNVTELNFDEFQPGMIARLNPGESIDTFSPRNPTGDARALSREIVREIGLALGLPLELSLLVTSDTTFHGYRGVVEAYKKTARRQQKQFAGMLRSRAYRWKVGHWIEDGLIQDSPEVRKHVIRFPAWAYVEPQKEATADNLRQQSFLASPRQIAAERGRDYDTIVKESTSDRAKLIQSAMDEAEPLGITWQELLGASEIASGNAPGPAPSATDDPDDDDPPARNTDQDDE